MDRGYFKRSKQVVTIKNNHNGYKDCTTTHIKLFYPQTGDGIMAKTKTTYTGKDVMDFVNSYVDNEQKKTDCFRLIELMQEWSGSEPKMWGPTIIGFGNYHYKYASGHEGDAPIIGFSPRKTAFSLYVYSPTESSKLMLADLGKYKMSKACIYAKKLSDINISTLHELCIESIKYINEHYECGCRIK